MCDYDEMPLIHPIDMRLLSHYEKLMCTNIGILLALSNVARPELNAIRANFSISSIVTLQL
jgi:hypothetical protein